MTKLLAAVAVVLLLSGLLLAYLGLSWWGLYFPPSWSFFLYPSGWVDMGLLVLAIVCFALARSHLPRIHGKFVAIVLLVSGLLLVPLSMLISPTVTGCFGPCGGPNVELVSLSATLIVPPGSGNATLTVRVRNAPTPMPPITAINVTNGRANNTATIPNIANMEFKYHGSLISPANPLPANETTTGSMKLANVTPGTAYSINVTLFFQDGTHYQGIVPITAQS
jgi:hypothetical protein